MYQRKTPALISIALCAFALSSWLAPADAHTYTTYEQALEDLDQNRFDAAADKLKRILAQNPEDADAHVTLARVYMDQENYAGTIAESSRTIEIDPKIFRAYAYRAYSLLQTGHIREAIPDCDKTIELYTVNPHDWSAGEVLGNRAKALRMTGRMKEAQADFEKEHVYNLLKEAEDERAGGRLESAVAKIDSALALDPSHADLWFMRGILGNNQGKYWQAVADFTRSMKYAPNASMLHYFRGDSYQQLGMHQKAVDDFTALINAKPRLVAYRFACETGRLRGELLRDDTVAVSLSDIYFLRAQSYTNLEKLALALKDLEAVVQADPKDDKAIAKRAELVLGSGKFDQAIREYTKAVAANPTDWTRYKERGDAYLQLGKNEEAINDYSKVVKLTPEEPGAYMFRALALKSIGRYKEAITDFSRVLKLHPDDDDAFMERSDCYRLMHRYKEALADLDRVAAILPKNNNFVSEARAHILAEQGNDGQARDEMLKLDKNLQTEVHKNDLRNWCIITALSLAALFVVIRFAFPFLKKRLNRKK